MAKYKQKICKAVTFKNKTVKWLNHTVAMYNTSEISFKQHMKKQNSCWERMGKLTNTYWR
jgi:hypothetical protein